MEPERSIKSNRHTQVFSVVDYYRCLIVHEHTSSETESESVRLYNYEAELERGPGGGTIGRRYHVLDRSDEDVYSSCS